MFGGGKGSSARVWSAGTPSSAADSVYAYTLAKDAATPGSKYVLAPPQSYEAADATTIQWWGKPGFVDPTYYTNFWGPLPQRLWSQFSATELQTADISSQAPMGYGAYVLKEWN